MQVQNFAGLSLISRIPSLLILDICGLQTLCKQVRSFPAPLRSFSAPLRSFPAPLHSFPAPLRSLPAPLRSLPAPLLSFSAPLRNFSAPPKTQDSLIFRPSLLLPGGPRYPKSARKVSWKSGRDQQNYEPASCVSRRGPLM